MDDLTLYESYLSGNDDALGELVEKYNTNLVFFLTQYTHNVYDAEDIAADTFLKIIIKKPKFEGNSSFKTWLYRIAINLALNYLKKSNRYQTEEISESVAGVSSDNIENEVILSDESKMLHQALKEINPKHSLALRLYYLEGFSLQEIAVIMKKTYRQVNNIVFFGKKLLKEKLIQMGYENYEDK